MFRPSKEPPRPGRIRVNSVGHIPELHTVRMLMVETSKNLGSLCEILITHGKPYLLTCQMDGHSAEPTWALYEEEGTKMLWSYGSDNLEMIQNVVAMSIEEQQGATKTDISALAPKAAEQPAQPKPSPSPPPAVREPDSFQEASPGWQAETQGSEWSSGAETKKTTEQQNTPPQPGAPQQGFPGAPQQGFPGAPQQGYPPGAPQQGFPGAPQQGYPPGYPAQPGYGQQQYPPGYPQQPYPGQGMPGQPWAPQGMPGQPGYPQGAPSDYPANQGYPGAAPSYYGQTAGAASAPTGDMSGFVDYLSNQPKITLSELLVGSHPIPAACVDIAMRLQEMVLRQSLTEPAAIEALKMAAQQGGQLTESILNAVKSSGSKFEETAKAIELLQQARLITDQDVTIAEGKVNAQTDIEKALIATGKVDELLFTAAKEANGFINAGRLRPDKAMIALHYCQRSRTSLTDALSELSMELD